MSKREPKIEIRLTQWDNWYGYIGGRKVISFFGSTPEQERAAKAWREAQLAERARYSWNRTGK